VQTADCSIFLDWRLRNLSPFGGADQQHHLGDAATPVHSWNDTCSDVHMCVCLFVCVDVEFDNVQQRAQVPEAHHQPPTGDQPTETAGEEEDGNGRQGSSRDRRLPHRRQGGPCPHSRGAHHPRGLHRGSNGAGGDVL